MPNNVDLKVVEGFGDEWAAYDQKALSDSERLLMFRDYFGIFPFETLPKDAVGFDLGCGSGRWALLVADRVGTLHCIDPSSKAVGVARNALAEHSNVTFHIGSANEMPLEDDSQDFGYSLGVLHHIPDTAAGLRAAIKKLKPGAPFLLYLYYRFDNRPAWFRMLWQASELGRWVISKLPFVLKKAMTELIALTIYLPLSRLSKLGHGLGYDVSSWPLSWYKDKSYFSLRTDAHDRFATRLERRFTKIEIDALMQSSGLTDIQFSSTQPHWVAVGNKIH
jgi:SAM-dependent methyltransferase